MNFFEYLSAEQDRADAKLGAMIGVIRRTWLIIVAAILGITGAVFVAQGFQSTHTETTGHLMWKHTTTTHVSLATRLGYLVLGLLFVLAAIGCIYVFIRRVGREAAQKKYVAILTGTERIPIQEVAAKTNQNTTAVVQDVQRMIDSGVLASHHIDHGRQLIVNTSPVATRAPKTVVTCPACGARTELAAGATGACIACGEPLMGA